MSDLKQWDFPKKVPGGYRVTLLFKTINGALDFLRSMGALGHNSFQKELDEWSAGERKKIEKEARTLNKWIRSWLKR